MQHIMLIDYQ